MKKTVLLILMAIITLAITVQTVSVPQEPEPWEKDQLVNPSELVKRLQESANQDSPLIIAVNPDGMYGLPFEGGIKGSKWFGPAEKEAHLKELRKFLEEVSRDKEIILYCGCCPFHVCPNIRPAFKLLNEMGFTRHKLLNLPKNIKENWIDKGYPMKNQ